MDSANSLYELEINKGEKYWGTPNLRRLAKHVCLFWMGNMQMAYFKDRCVW
jgi:hypothetical protein